MNTLQLQRYMINDPFIRERFGGVVAIDQLPLYVEKPSVFIVNTDPISLPGKHWVVLYIDRVSEHFDSSGLQPRPRFKNYLITTSDSYLFNSMRVQNVASKSCGLFCLFYCYFRCRDYTFKQIMEMFSENLALNEMTVHLFYRLTV